MSASEQALLLLEALSSGDVGIFLSGKPLALFVRQDGVQQILDALRLHYSAHLHLRQSEVSLCTEAGAAKMARALVTPSYDTKHNVTK